MGWGTLAVEAAGVGAPGGVDVVKVDGDAAAGGCSRRGGGGCGWGC